MTTVTLRITFPITHRLATEIALGNHKFDIIESNDKCSYTVEGSKNKYGKLHEDLLYSFVGKSTLWKISSSRIRCPNNKLFPPPFLDDPLAYP